MTDPAISTASEAGSTTTAPPEAGSTTAPPVNHSPPDTDPTARNPASPQPVVFENGSEPGPRKVFSRRITHKEDDCHLCSDHENGADYCEGGRVRRRYNRVYSRDEFEEVAHGAAGRLVKRMGMFAYLIFFIIPLAYVAIFFAIVPLGDPRIPDISNQWVFIFISNGAVILAISYLYNAAFLGMARSDTPFRTSLIPLGAVFVAEIGVLTPILLTYGVFNWLGIVALGVCYITLYVSMYFAYGERREIVHSFFKRFMLLLILYIPLLVGYVIAYREITSSTAQSAITFCLAFITFIYRRVMLSKLDPFPLEFSQLMAGFWVQNLSDCTSILAFPQVSSPSVYAALFLSGSLQNVAFLGFVSDVWIYKLRPTIKNAVLNGIKCNFPLPPVPKPDESFDPVNRGHDANVGGYRRRQFRFFFFRLLSQAVAMVLYLGISPMLRYGLNKDFNSLSLISDRDYRNSMIFSASNLIFIVLVGVIGYMFLHRSHHATFHEIREIHLHDLLHHTMVGMVTAIITHNMIVTGAIVLSHYCIFSSFDTTDGENRCVLQSLPN